MFNYIRSEWYLIRHNRSFLVSVGCMAGLMLLLILMAYYSFVTFEKNGSESFYLSLLYTTGTSFFAPVTLIISGSLENDEFKKHHTLKSSVSFGFSREELYLGKLFAQLSACTLAYVSLALFYFVTGLLFLGVPDSDSVILYIRALLGIYPLCLGFYAMVFCFLLNLGGGWGGVLAALGATYGLPYLFLFLGQKVPLLQIPAYYNPVNMMRTQWTDREAFFYWDTPSGMGLCYLTAAVYFILFTAIGLYWFKKREIR